MSELSSLPSPSSLVRGINLSSIVNSPPYLNCGSNISNKVVVIGKPTNTSLPLLLPINNVTIQTSVSFTNKETLTNSYGIALIGCFFVGNLPGYSIRVKHPSVNFGKGIGAYSDYIYRNVTEQAKTIIVQGDYDIPCNIGSVPNPILSGFNLGSIPSINVGVPAFNMGEYGLVYPSSTRNGIVLSIFVNDKKVFETTKTTDTSTVFDFPGTLQNILTGTTPFSSPLTPGSTVSVYAIATMGSCQKKSNISTITLPLLPPAPEQLCREISTRLNSATGKIIPPSVIIPGASSVLNISGLEDFCKTDPTNNKFISPSNRVGYVTLEGKQLQFNVYGGIAAIDLSNLVTSQQVITTQKDKTTPFNQGSLASIQAYLPTGYFAPGDNFETIRGTYYKIIRPNKSYFSALSFEEIDRYLRG